MAYKGQFRPKNPHKYKGDSNNIIYRSRWELMLMQKFDEHPDVLEWQSEEIVIPYRSPLDNRIHRYFPDFYVKQRNRHGELEKILIEVKPHAQTKAPRPRTEGSKDRRYLREVGTWGVNSSKWKAAENFCLDRGWKFQIITEHDLGLTF